MAKKTQVVEEVVTPVVKKTKPTEGRQKGLEKVSAVIKTKSKKQLAKEAEERAAAAALEVKKARKYHPGVRAQMNAKRLMENPRGITSVKPMIRLVKDIIAEQKDASYKVSFERNLMKALAGAVDLYLTIRFRDAAFNASYGGKTPKKIVDIDHYVYTAKSRRNSTIIKGITY